MDRNQKFVKKLSSPERDKLIVVIEMILDGNFANLDIQKMTGHQDIYRVRVGSIRIIFIANRHENTILVIDRRNDNTYGDF